MRARSRTKKLTSLILGVSLLSIVLGLITFFNTGILFWSTPTGSSFMAPRLYDGICLLLAGLALGAAVLNRALLAKLSAFVLLLTALFTFASYLNRGTTSWLSKILVSILEAGNVTNETILAPNTAVVFSLIAIAVLIFIRKIKTQAQPLELGTLGLLIIGLGLSALLGYASGIETAYSWNSFIFMSLPVALVVTCLGVAVSALAWRKGIPAPAALQDTWRNMITYAISGIIVVALMSSILPLMPLYNYIHNVTDKSLSLLVMNQAMGLNRVLADLGDELKLVSARGIEDNSLFNDHIHLRGLTRYDLAGNELKSVGERVPSYYAASLNSTETVFKGSVKLADSVRLIASIPRLSPNGLVIGTDLASIGLLPLEEAFDQNASHYSGSRSFLFELGKDGNSTLLEFDATTGKFQTQASTEDTLLDLFNDPNLVTTIQNGLSKPLILKSPQSVATYAQVKNSPYIVLTSIETAQAYSSINKQILHYIGIALILAMIGAAGIYMLSTEVLVSGSALQMKLQRSTRVLSSESNKRLKAETELSQSRANTELIVANAPDGIITVDTDFKITSSNPAANNIFHYKEKELLGASISLIVPSFASELINKEDLSVKGDKNQDSVSAFSLRTTGKRKDGTELPLELRVTRGSLAVGAVTTFFVQDISQQQANEARIKETLAEKELLIKEIHHRVKNNMQIISSLLNLQSRSLKGEDKRILQIFKDSESRIQSIALLHDLLYRSESMTEIDLEAYVNKLVFRLLSYYNAEGKNLNIQVDISKVTLNFDTAIPLGLLINELLSNALKHAFEGRTYGDILVQVKRQGEDKYQLIVSDNGIGLPSDIDLDSSQFLGLRLVKNLSKQINGNLDLGNSENKEGTHIQVLFGNAN